MVRTPTKKGARAPQGAKRVAQAFFDELETIAEDKQAEVAKATQAMVRDTMMGRREKAKAAKAKMRAGKAAPVKSKAGAKPERKTRGPTRKRKAPSMRQSRASESGSDNAPEVEAAEET